MSWKLVNKLCKFEYICFFSFSFFCFRGVWGTWGFLVPHQGTLDPLGSILGYLGSLLGTLEASWRPLVFFLEPLGGLLGASSGGRLKFSVRVPPLGLFWGRLGALLGCLGRLLGRFEALLGRLRTLLGASWAVLGRCWGPRRSPWSVGSSERR